MNREDKIRSDLRALERERDERPLQKAQGSWRRAWHRLLADRVAERAINDADPEELLWARHEEGQL